MTMLLPPVSKYGRSWPSVRHYYGDVVRALFVIIAILVGILIPLSGDMRIAAVFGAPVVITLIVLAGFTSPRGRLVLVCDAIVAALGVLAAEVLAVSAYGINMIAFLSFEVIAILFLVALYYGVKNVRALSLHQIGQIDGVGEFSDREFTANVKE